VSVIDSHGREPGWPKYEEAYQDGRIIYNYTDRWRVLTNIEDETTPARVIADDLPSKFSIGQPFDGFGTFITKRTFDRDPKNRKLYYMNLTATSSIDEQGASDLAKPPDQRLTKWAWDFDTIGMAFTRDVDDGRAVANVNGEPIEVEHEVIIPILTIERWEIFFDADTILNLVNHRNNSPFWGAPAGAAVCSGIRDRPDEVFNGIEYRKVTYTFKFRVPDIEDDLGFPIVSGWKEILLNRGTFYIEGGTKKHLTAQGARIDVKLANDGNKLGDSADPVYLNFNKYPKANFDAYGLNIFQI
jgi:hypothetical protein